MSDQIETAVEMVRRLDALEAELRQLEGWQREGRLGRQPGVIRRIGFLPGGWESMHFAGRGSAWPHGIIDLGPIDAVRERIVKRGLRWFVDEVRSRAQAVNLFRVWVEWARREEPDETEAWLAWLRGHDLMCWCPLEDGNGNRVPCHADVLLELANGGAE